MIGKVERDDEGWWNMEWYIILLHFVTDKQEHSHVVIHTCERLNVKDFAMYAHVFK